MLGHVPALSQQLNKVNDTCYIYNDQVLWWLTSQGKTGANPFFFGAPLHRFKFVNHRVNEGEQGHHIAVFPCTGRRRRPIIEAATEPRAAAGATT